MRRHAITRRDILKASAVLVFASPARAAAPPAESVTPALIAAARKEGAVVWYTSADLQLAETVAKAFEKKFGLTARVERAGAERIFTRVAQEYAAGIHTVDVSNTGDAAMFGDWKQRGLLAAYVPADVARNIPAEHRDPDGCFAIVRSTLCVIAYNPTMVQRADAPKSFADLLDPKWRGKLVKGNPSYSGTVITSTYQLVRNLGWPYLEKLSKQQVMQVQSATDTPKRVILGERPVMVDGNEYNVLIAKEGGKPIEPVYASEGSPLIVMPSAIFKAAPHPSAARLFQNFLFSAEGQQLFVDAGGLRSLHAQVKDRPGRIPLSSIKVMNTDPAGLLSRMDDIKRRYTEYFRV
ncbi:MAG: extracellular solute-binding protein [Rhizobiales bacterium]|nr:extracellular solute-binding protein [Hyphomicrobiales bacterium]